MALIRTALVSGSTGIVAGWEMWCPGCQDLHAVNTGRNGWFFNGNEGAPTFEPSLLVMYGSSPGDRRCHSFIRHGHWQFLADSTHPLAGTTVEMVEIP